MSEQHPKVGVGVVIRKDGKVLMGLRKGNHATGTWCCPGGHLEMGESWEECARREVLEECGLTISTPTFGWITNDVFGADKHYITIAMIADYVSGEPQVLEPHKMDSWQWVSWDALPEPLMLPSVNAKRMGFDPFNLPAAKKAA